MPIKACFCEEGLQSVEEVSLIQQRKGEAEMAQVDWLYTMLEGFKTPGEGIASIVTSGDIDSVVIHLFSIAHTWPRKENGQFLHPVYVVLQKPMGFFDIYLY